MSVLGPPLFGFLADALGLRGHLLRLACGGAFLGFAAVATLGLVSKTPTLAALLAAVVVFGFFRSPMVMMADVVALEQSTKRGIPYGETRLFGSLGFLVSSAIAGRFVDPNAPADIPIAVAALLFITFLTTFTLPAKVRVPARPQPRDMRAFLENRDVRLFLLGAFLAQSAFACYDQCFSLHLMARGASPTLVGAAWALGTLAEVLLMAKASAIATRLPPPTLLAIAYGVSSLRWLLIGILPGVWPLLALQPLHAIAFALGWVSALAFIRERTPGTILGTMQGLFTATVSAGSVTGMLVWIQIYRTRGGPFAFRCAAVVSLIACVCALAFRHKEREIRNSRPG